MMQGACQKSQGGDKMCCWETIGLEFEISSVLRGRNLCPKPRVHSKSWELGEGESTGNGGDGKEGKRTRVFGYCICYVGG